MAHRSLKNSFSWRTLLIQMSSKQALDSLDMAELRYFLNELLELTGEGMKDAFLRDLPQKLNGRCENEAFVMIGLYLNRCGKTIRI